MTTAPTNEKGRPTGGNGGSGGSKEASTGCANVRRVDRMHREAIRVARYHIGKAGLYIGTLHRESKIGKPLADVCAAYIALHDAMGALAREVEK